jgi:hypothetical protein
MDARSQLTRRTAHGDHCRPRAGDRGSRTPRRQRRAAVMADNSVSLIPVAPAGLSRRAQRFVEVDGVRVPRQDIRRHRDAWIGYGIPAAEIERAAAFQDRWGWDCPAACPVLRRRPPHPGRKPSRGLGHRGLVRSGSTPTAGHPCLPAQTDGWNPWSLPPTPAAGPRPSQGSRARPWRHWTTAATTRYLKCRAFRHLTARQGLARETVGLGAPQMPRSARLRPARQVGAPRRLTARPTWPDGPTIAQSQVCVRALGKKRCWLLACAGRISACRPM